MSLTIFGSGYVGLVTGACLAVVGNHVVCMDVDNAKNEHLDRVAGKSTANYLQQVRPNRLYSDLVEMDLNTTLKVIFEIS